jgi:hypothetical protein
MQKHFFFIGGFLRDPYAAGPDKRLKKRQPSTSQASKNNFLF